MKSKLSLKVFTDACMRMQMRSRSHAMPTSSDPVLAKAQAAATSTGMMAAGQVWGAAS